MIWHCNEILGVLSELVQRCKWNLNRTQNNINISPALIITEAWFQEQFSINNSNSDGADVGVDTDL